MGSPVLLDTQVAVRVVATPRVRAVVEQARPPRLAELPVAVVPAELPTGEQELMRTAASAAASIPPALEPHLGPEPELELALKLVPGLGQVPGLEQVLRPARGALPELAMDLEPSLGPVL